jgi:hypothetical protein
MFCTDSLEDMAVLLAAKAAQWIPAKNIYVVRLGDLIPKLFQPNGRLAVA